MSSLALVPENPAEQLDLIKRTVAKGATDDELKLFLYDCQRRNVHPLDKLIHFTVRVDQKTGKRTYTPITSIDFMRSQAADSGDYAGNDDAVFNEGGDNQAPVSACVTVYRMVQGQRCPFTATARWDEYYPGDRLGFMWNKMPYVMLGKCAEALALRKAFPRQLAGLYAREEMDQAGQEPKFDKETYVEHKLAELKGETVKSLPKDAVDFAWRERLKNCSTPQEFNEVLPDMASLPVSQKTTVKKILVERANACGLAWDKAKSAFYDPDAKPDVKAMLEDSLAQCEAEERLKAAETPENQPDANADALREAFPRLPKPGINDRAHDVETLPKNHTRYTGLLKDVDLPTPKSGRKFGTGFLCWEEVGLPVECPITIWDKKVQPLAKAAENKEITAVIKRTVKDEGTQDERKFYDLVSFELVPQAALFG